MHKRKFEDHDWGITALVVFAVMTTLALPPLAIFWVIFYFLLNKGKK